MISLKNKKIVVTGGDGFLGRHVVQNLHLRGIENITIPRSKNCDLREKENCKKVAQEADIIIHLAANVGGIGYNQNHPAELFFDNLIMGTLLMDEAFKSNVEKFITVGTVCSYPKFSPIPFNEENLWKGYPEETNAPYGIAKKTLLVQSQAYREQYGFNSIYLLPVNLYGPFDNFNPKSSHVIPALIKKIDDAIQSEENEITVWGDGSASREFLFVSDAAEGIIKALINYDDSQPVNLGSGHEINIKNLVELITKNMNFNGNIIWDTSKPNGQPRRCLDISKSQKLFGFEPKTDMEEGLKQTIKWYQAQKTLESYANFIEKKHVQ